MKISVLSNIFREKKAFLEEMSINMQDSLQRKLSLRYIMPVRKKTPPFDPVILLSHGMQEGL